MLNSTSLACKHLLNILNHKCIPFYGKAAYLHRRRALKGEEISKSFPFIQPLKLSNFLEPSVFLFQKHYLGVIVGSSTTAPPHSILKVLKKGLSSCFLIQGIYLIVLCALLFLKVFVESFLNWHCSHLPVFQRTRASLSKVDFLLW